MILAEQYKLKVPIVGSGGAYEVDGQRELVNKKKLIPLEWAIERNKSPNSEYFKFYEEETKELEVIRQKNVIKNAENKRKEELGMNDLIDAIAGKGVKEPTNEPTEIEMLKKLCDMRGIKYHHLAKVDSLNELLNAK